MLVATQLGKYTDALNLTSCSVNMMSGISDFRSTYTLTWHQQAVTDCPCANFALELIDAYPDAKIVLQTRDPDAWVRSMEISYYRVMHMIGWHPGKYSDLVGILPDIPSANDQKPFNLHRTFGLHLRKSSAWS